MTTPTAGVIGLGFGRAHIAAFQARGCQVVGLCQRDEAAALKVAKARRVRVDLVRWHFGEWRRGVGQAGIAHPARPAPGVARPPGAEDYCVRGRAPRGLLLLLALLLDALDAVAPLDALLDALDDAG
ncbi:MAG: hypothetical protein HYU26_01010 [Candidatus Rokubacteria bacterium]|nr:hypothetical protein [Candidatus Rokubacteria bacterium]